MRIIILNKNWVFWLSPSTIHWWLVVTPHITYREVQEDHYTQWIVEGGVLIESIYNTLGTCCDASHQMPWGSGGPLYWMNWVFWLSPSTIHWGLVVKPHSTCREVQEDHYTQGIGCSVWDQLQYTWDLLWSLISHAVRFRRTIILNELGVPIESIYNTLGTCYASLHIP